jgi:hypothetical protein
MEFAMSFDCAAPDNPSGFEISARFRKMIEGRIARLEEDANQDEALLPHLENSDHARRQRRLIEAQRAEAMRMRRFLENSRTRFPDSLIVR